MPTTFIGPIDTRNQFIGPVDTRTQQTNQTTFIGPIDTRTQTNTTQSQFIGPIDTRTSSSNSDARPPSLDQWIRIQNNKNVSNLSMRLFGAPYQFTDQVDPRVGGVSDTVGKKFLENILMEAPVCTIIPGEPTFLPGSSKDRKMTTGQAILESAANSTLEPLRVLAGENKDDDLRLYDFKNNYTSYMNYVNALCRVGACYLGIDNEEVVINGESVKLGDYDWRNYRWTNNAKRKSWSDESISTIVDRFLETIGTTADAYVDSVKTLFKKTDTSTDVGQLNEILTNYNFVQFFIDPDVSPNETMQNRTGESMLKSYGDQGSNFMKDIAFIANSGAIEADKLQAFAGNTLEAFESGIGQILGGASDNAVGSFIHRFINLGSNVLQGHNLVIPDVYQSSEYSKGYSITVHLKTPYGTRLGYFLDIYVPMMHLLALALPKQESANSYSSPFIMKAYVDNIFSCNLGIVENIQISKQSDSFSVDGLPTEVDITLSIADLYSNISMTPLTSPTQFINNSSLMEYIATNCGVSLTSPNIEKKWETTINLVTGSFKNIMPTIKGEFEERVYSNISKFTNLYR